MAWQRLKCNAADTVTIVFVVCQVATRNDEGRWVFWRPEKRLEAARRLEEDWASPIKRLAECPKYAAMMRKMAGLESASCKIVAQTVVWDVDPRIAGRDKILVDRVSALLELLD